MIFHTLTRGTLLLAAGRMLSLVIHFPNILSLVGALLTWAVLLSAMALPASVLRFSWFGVALGQRSKQTLKVALAPEGIRL